MAGIQRGDWLLASILFFIGNIGVSGTTVFYDSLLPPVARPRGNRSRVGRRLCARAISAAASCCSSTSRGSCSRRRSGLPIRRRRPRRRSSAWRCGGCCLLDPAAAARSRAAGRARSRRAMPIDRAARRGLRPARPDVPRDPPLPARLPAVHRDAALSGRHSDDHPHGLDLRRRDRHRSERADRRVRDGAVPRAFRSRSCSARSARASAPSARCSSRWRSTRWPRSSASS